MSINHYESEKGLAPLPTEGFRLQGPPQRRGGDTLHYEFAGVTLSLCRSDTVMLSQCWGDAVTTTLQE